MKHKKQTQTNWNWVDVKLLKKDGDNPNKMSDKQKASLKANMEKFGWNMPIITDMDYVIADGEQKLDVALEMGLEKVPILMKQLTPTERKIIRQSMNKIGGNHDEDLDAAEFKRILENSDMETLSSLTSISEQEILNLFNKTDEESKELLKKSSQEMDVEQKRTIICPSCKTEIEINKK